VLTTGFFGEDGRVKRLQAVRVHWQQEGHRLMMEEVPGESLTLDCELNVSFVRWRQAYKISGGVLISFFPLVQPHQDAAGDQRC
jgi:hypothetical protein